MTRQKRLLIDVAVVLTITALAVVSMIHLKDYINRREALLAMEQLGEKILAYREAQGALPPEETVQGLMNQVAGRARLGRFTYRAPWITPESKPDALLAFTQQDYESLLVSDGYIVLRLNGTVQWLDARQFNNDIVPMLQ
ncbi:MAG: hypothetical protein K9N55_08705 [Phycisphaerae bacterium]|nr:hypothetical protein [Phycisphaerae bacterium]